MPVNTPFQGGEGTGADARLSAMRDVGRRAEELIGIARDLDRIAEGIESESTRRDIRAALRRLLGVTEGIIRSARAAIPADAPR
ncbi:hypothetical protein SAMN05444722_1728 [Rhodovulum sp. ES.010]|uniref:hypothetical protein n=1 Tax=Rhodovulum sp. ES.010 TaxID=1882821 RepID=UPI000928B89F|nr:hypothetical protein [Rhodovulum sp. ES.010]SIO37174.1 hypothetical protein SAMN05444722_1728 [Rhodovulum sp. ES.010]